MNSSVLEWESIPDVPWSGRRKPQVVQHNGKIVLLGGFGGEFSLTLNDVWNWDGNEWKLVCNHAGWTGRDGHCAVVCRDNIFVLGGTNDPMNCKSDIWKSPDGGKTWVQLLDRAFWPERWQHAACVQSNKMYISGGWGEGYFYNDVWSSTDGINWELMCGIAPWKARMFHSFISFNNVLYIIGGYDGRSQLNDVWASTDGGYSWIEMCDESQWPARQGHSCVPLDNKVYLMGGLGESNQFNDLWESRDCVHWKQLTDSCSWSARQDQAVCAFEGSLYLFGGFDETIRKYNNDCYQFTPIPDDPSLNHVIENPASIALGRLNSNQNKPGSASSSSSNRRDTPFSKKKSEPSVASSIPLSKIKESIQNLRSNRSNHTDMMETVVSIIDKSLHVVGFYSGGGSGGEISNSQKDGSTSGSGRLGGLIPDELAASAGAGGSGASDASAESLVDKLRTVSASLQFPSIKDFLTMKRGLGKSSTDLASLDTFSFSGSSSGKEHYGGIGNSSSGVVGSGYKSLAVLREAMSEDRVALRSVLAQIRKAAEARDTSDFARLSALRTSTANKAMVDVNQLQRQIEQAKQTLEQQLSDAAHLLREIEEVNYSFIDAKQSTPNMDGKTLRVTCFWSDWEDILDSAGRLMNETCSSSADEAIAALSETVTQCGQLSSQITAWLSQDHITPAKRKTATSEEFISVNQSSDRVFSEYDECLSRLDSCKSAVKITIDTELENIFAKETQVKQLLRFCVTKGAELNRRVSQALAQSLAQCNTLQTEVSSWAKTLQSMLSEEQLKTTSAKYIQDNSVLQEKLLLLEDQRIDLKSTLDKAVLRRSAPEIESLKDKLAVAEKAVKEARMELSNWYRTHRRYAIEVYPELFHYLPDLIVPGSILGDGGFAENAKIPHRNFEDYLVVSTVPEKETKTGKALEGGSGGTVAASEGRAELSRANSGSSGKIRNGASIYDLVDNDANGSSSSSSSSGESLSRVLLKATYEGEMVVLKAFKMHNPRQRKGLEREISILGRFRNDCIIVPGAMVEGTAEDVGDSNAEFTVYIEYPFFPCGNLTAWLKQVTRKPWELQSVGRQLVNALAFLHENGVIHKDLKPSNILMHEDGRLVVSDFDIAFRSKDKFGTEHSDDPEEEKGVISARTNKATRGFIAPEIEAGQRAQYASDLYSLGAILYYMHFPTLFDSLIPGQSYVPGNSDSDLTSLIQALLQLDPADRPTSASAAKNVYFTTTFVDRLINEGEVVEQDRKLEAVRNLLSRTRYLNRLHHDKLSVHRDNVLPEVLEYFENISLSSIRSSLKVTFIGEAGVDEGGLLAEMFNIFFDNLFLESTGLFEGPAGSNISYSSNSRSNSLTTSRDAAESVSQSSNGAGGGGDASSSSASASGGGATTPISQVVMPCGHDKSLESIQRYRAIGRILVKALYEGQRIGNKLCPAVLKFITGASPNMRDLQMFDPQLAKSLQWTLSTQGVEEFGLNFESVGEPDLGIVTDANKTKFIRLKIESILIHSRLPQLEAIKTGFTEALKAISEEAAPFMSLLSHTDWRVMLCEDSIVNAEQIISALVFTGFPKKSELPQWLKEILSVSSEDNLRKFLIFSTGSPHLSTSFASFSDRAIKINVRYQNRTGSLPVAHTCFFQLDIPNYRDKETLQNKLYYSIQNAVTFDVV